jgi:hypothetical protein
VLHASCCHTPRWQGRATKAFQNVRSGFYWFFLFFFGFYFRRATSFGVKDWFLSMLNTILQHAALARPRGERWAHIYAVDFIGFFWFFLVFIFGAQPVLVLRIVFLMLNTILQHAALARPRGERWAHIYAVDFIGFFWFFLVFIFGAQPVLVLRIGFCQCVTPFCSTPR